VNKVAVQQIPLVGAQVLAALIQAGMEESHLRLFVSGYAPTPGETLADLEAVEATFSGYPAGGYPLAAWGEPTVNPYGGYQTVAPQTQVVYTPPGSGSGVSNTIAGWFITNMAGDLIADGLFDQTIPMDAVGDGFPISVALFSGTLQALVQSWVYGSEQ
jgi:hypothetical protein